MHLKYQAWIRTVSTDTSLTQPPQVMHITSALPKSLWQETLDAMLDLCSRAAAAAKVQHGIQAKVQHGVQSQNWWRTGCRYGCSERTQRECDTANICDEPMQRKRPVAFQNRAHPRFLVLPVTANPVSKQIGHHWQHDTAWMCSILTKLTHKLIEVHEVPGSPWYQTLDDMLNMSTAKVKHGIQNLNAY